MLEASRAARSQVLRLVEVDRKRSESLEIVLRARSKKTEVVDSKVLRYLLTSAASIAAMAMSLISTEIVPPNGIEPESLFTKLKTWILDLAKSKGEKEKAKEAIGTQVGPSPLSSASEVASNRVKTAKPNAEVLDALKRASSAKNVDYALLYSVAGAESSFRSGVAASTSSATGLFQFTTPTWKYLTEKYKLPYTAEDRKDPRKAAEVAGMYLTDINTSLQRVLGRKPSYGEIYMGYFLGPGGAARFLKALKKDPDAIGADLFSRAAKANPGVFYDKGKPLTLRQILAKQEGKITSYAQDADPRYAREGQSDQQSSPVQVAFPNPGAAQAGSNTATATRPSLGGNSQSGGSSAQRVVAKPAPVRDVSAGYPERAPEVSEASGSQGSPGKQLHIIPEGSQPQPTAIVRGRDNRLYVLNT